jgi:hypothetical protein
MLTCSFIETHLVLNTLGFLFVQVLLNVPSIHNSDDAIQGQLSC